MLESELIWRNYRNLTQSADWNTGKPGLKFIGKNYGLTSMPSSLPPRPLRIASASGRDLGVGAAGKASQLMTVVVKN